MGSFWGGQDPGANREQLLRGGEPLAGEPAGDTGFRVLGQQTLAGVGPLAGERKTLLTDNAPSAWQYPGDSAGLLSQSGLSRGLFGMVAPGEPDIFFFLQV